MPETENNRDTKRQIEDRFMEICTDHNLTYAQFAKKLNVTIYMIDNIKGHRNTKKDLTTDPISDALCQAFNVNKNWLLTGIGNKYLPQKTTVISTLQQEYNLSDQSVILLENFLRLSPMEQDEFITLVGKVFDLDRKINTNFKIINSSTNEQNGKFQPIAAESISDKTFVSRSNK